jgi:pimeloyl-ACP methyl ester carboxylesterase
LFDIRYSKKNLNFSNTSDQRWDSGLQLVICLLAGLIGLYLLFTLICTYFVQQLPRNPVSPARLASEIKMPAMIIHGAKDKRFPLAFALKLKRGFAPGQAEIYVGAGAGHSDSSQTSGYVEAMKSFLDRHLNSN